MTSTALLVVSNIKQIGPSLRAVEKYVKNLYIHLNIPVTEATTQLHPVPRWGKLISQLYVDCAGYNTSIDLRILIGSLKNQGTLHRAPFQLKPIDMLFSDSHASPDSICEQLRSQLNIPSATIYINNGSPAALYDSEQLQSSFVQEQEKDKTYDTVVLGGTFDRIHLGHKIFLTQAVLRASKRLVVGVTAANMTKGKTLAELILPVEERINEVKSFLMEIDATLQYDVVAIEDPFGPTQSDPNMDMIVVSAETLRGGHKVNELRAKNNLRPLDIFCIDVVESSLVDGPKETKISSSNTRIDLLGTRIRAPEPRPKLPVMPYIVGLTGGIASGKSNMAQRFQDKGAYILDCDKIAHELYEPGQVCYDKIVNYFGNDVLDMAGRIDRSKLGPIVFAAVQQLEALNNIVWPELMLEVKRRIQQIYAKNSSVEVVVLEAAILLKAGWETECHEVWSMIIPPEEAIKRTMQRNSLSEQEARRRLSSQISNSEIVAKSNIIFSSQWNPEFTQEQADKAWQMLMHELEQRKERSML